MSGTSAWQALVRLSVYCSIHKSLHHDSAEIVPFSIIVMPGRHVKPQDNITRPGLLIHSLKASYLDEGVVLRRTQRFSIENYYSNSLGRVR